MLTFALVWLNEGSIGYWKKLLIFSNLDIGLDLNWFRALHIWIWGAKMLVILSGYNLWLEFLFALWYFCFLEQLVELLEWGWYRDGLYYLFIKTTKLGKSETKKYGLQFVTKFKLRVLRHWFGFLVAEVGTAAEFGHKNGWAPHWSWSWVFWPSSQSMALAAVLAPHWRCSKRFTLCLDLQAKVWLWRTFAQLRGEIRFKMKCNLLPSTYQKRKKNCYLLLYSNS